jgi:thiamine kinase-like enzyme
VGKVDLVLGHNDLLPANILRNKDRFWLVDWEYGGYNSPLFDLGGFATNCGLPPEAEHLMLERYYGTEPDADLMQSYDAMKCGSLLRETMWSMVSEITSELDFDYGAYTNANLEKYSQAFKQL